MNNIATCLQICLLLILFSCTKRNILRVDIFLSAFKYYQVSAYLFYLFIYLFIIIFYIQKGELPTYEDDDTYDDDNPTVVVLSEGDLTSEEALKEKLAKEHGMKMLYCPEFYLKY